MNMTTEQWLEILPLILQVLGIVFAPVLLWLAAQMRTKLGVDIEAAKKVIEGGNRDALNMALTTAATLAVAKGLIGRQAADFIVGYLRQSSPEATAAAAPVLQEKIEAALATAATDELGKLVKDLGGVDKLRDALATAQRWTPKD